jgi:ribonuclease I
MHHRIGACAGKRSFDFLAVVQIAFDELCAPIDGAVMAFAQIIEDRSFVAVIKKQFRANASDIARTANDKNFHPAKFRRA